ncbi:glycolate oxidase subunit GlcF [Undibacterium cyanobacteriorum]|uniref:Glycolate oxidase iron-sulfur subunit n=1 Tax=Undibacterium cyanobacteriorum TaxID=3073561 RepID=A0ABY9RF53_9BURK|nr:glycolate oxidase subunit GlcF [Undibacterium sp. 20NA77.5]WMW79847.1 glycolate oxidase subunit GlcF [Undibacterium sp. 20NA77.5]
MQTNLLPEIRATIEGAEAESILRSCVHCGMCNATCPTYQLLGDELDGPRGRIYLIKQMLEGQQVSAITHSHLDRCLSCRSCETTCPSGVQYHRLLDIGRTELERRSPRNFWQSLLRAGLKHGLTNPRLFNMALHLGRGMRAVLPDSLQKKIPLTVAPELLKRPVTQHPRQVLLLAGCVQSALGPEINAATARVLDVCGVQAIEIAQSQCCGAVALHLSDAERARQQARQTVDAWWPHLQSGAEAIVMTASGCGLMVHDYPELLAQDPVYAEKSKVMASKSMDVGRYLSSFRHQLIERLGGKIEQTLAWHAPCSLRHGLREDRFVEDLLRELGAEVRTCRDAHLCCGSAGTYSILQGPLSQQLRDQKVEALQECEGERIVSANMACQLHLQTGTNTPVEHWIMLLDRAIDKT